MHTRGSQKNPVQSPCITEGCSCHHQHFAVPKEGNGLVSPAGPCWRGFHTKAILRTMTSSAKLLPEQRVSPVPCFGKRLEVPARTLQGSWLRRLLSDRGSEATGGVGAVIMGKKRGQSLRGGVVPRPGSVGAGSPGRITNLRFPSACAVSAWYGKPRR